MAKPVSNAAHDNSSQTTLYNRYASTRRTSEALCQPLASEDYILQAMPDASPSKWHLAHTTWFFETFLLKPFLHGYQVYHPQFEYLFNSYYQAVGAQYPRPARGLLSRPTVAEVYCYRAHVDAAMETLLDCATPGELAEVIRIATLGCQHEQQHQELLLTDIKYNLSVNPLSPAYRSDLPETPVISTVPLKWIEYTGGVREIGYSGENFAFDNEMPRYRVYLRPFALASRLVTCDEYLEFMEAGGYQRPEFWLADGWRMICDQRWDAPLYWVRTDNRWWQYTLAGLRPVSAHEPVCHVSYYESDAYARWAGKRLPIEAEWETAAARLPITGNLRENGYLHPAAAPTGATAPVQIFGDVWEWTGSPYTPYPGYRATEGALGEYNGKFMVNQMVLRGGSCVTPVAHIRATYRNFFYPADRWQFTGIRLAEDR